VIVSNSENSLKPAKQSQICPLTQLIISPKLSFTMTTNNKVSSILIQDKKTDQIVEKSQRQEI